MADEVLLWVKSIMEEDGTMFREVDLVEVIHVELSDEGRISVMPVVLGEYDFL